VFGTPRRSVNITVNVRIHIELARASALDSHTSDPSGMRYVFGIHEKFDEIQTIPRLFFSFSTAVAKTRNVLVIYQISHLFGFIDFVVSR